MVEINGKYYFADLTFDLSKEYENCLVVNEYFRETHKLNSDSKKKLEGLDFSESDFIEPDIIQEVIDGLYERLGLSDTIEKVKSLQIDRGRKSKKEKIDALTGYELAKLIGLDNLMDNAKSLKDDFEEAIDSDIEFRAESTDSITIQVEKDINNKENQNQEHNQDHNVE